MADRRSRRPPNPPPHHRGRLRARPHRRFSFAQSIDRWASRYHNWCAQTRQQLHGQRTGTVLLALGLRQKQVQSGIVYASAEQLAQMTGVDERTVQRAIADFQAMEDGPIQVVRPNPCPGGCRYQKRPCPGFHGGKTLDEQGRPVGAANGFMLNPAWTEAVRHLSSAPTPAPGKPTRAMREAEAKRWREALARPLAETSSPKPAASDERSAPAMVSVLEVLTTARSP